MGFKRPTYTITYPAGHSYHGLEVRTRSVPIEQLLQVQGALASLPDSEADFAHLTTKEQSAIVGTIADTFSEALVSWNLENDDGTPVPTTAEAVRKEDFAIVLSLVMRWIKMVGSVDEELGKDSAAGPPSVPVESIPMDVLSPNPVS